MDRKKLYKKHLHSPMSIKKRLQIRSAAQRKERREMLLSRKRARFEQMRESTAEEEYDTTVDQIVEATKKLVDKSPDQLVQLTFIKNGFTQGSALVDAFLSVEGSTTTLVDLLSSTEAEVQLNAVWCVANMAANSDEHALHAMELAGPSLIKNLQTDNQELQDASAWGLGNIAGADDKCRDLLYTQQVLPPLVQLLKTDNTSVLRSVAFALSNLARETKDNAKHLVTEGALPLLLEKIKFDTDRQAMRSLSEILWVVAYISASGEFEEQLVSSGMLERCVAILHEVTEHNLSHYHLITPLMRTLGNVIACSHSVETIAQACANTDFLPCLVKCLHKDHPNINKEALWVLSNVTTSEAACKQLVEKELLSPVIQQIHGLLDCRIEAAYSLCNMANFGAEYCGYLMKEKVLSGLVDLLTSPDNEAVKLGLTLIEKVLSHADESSLDSGKAEFEAVPESMEAMEKLEYHTDPELQTLASGILQKYFYKEEDPLKGEKGQGDGENGTNNEQVSG